MRRTLMGRRRAGTRDERSFWRMVFVGLIGTFMFVAMFATSPSGLHFGSSAKKALHSTAGQIIPRSLLSAKENDNETPVSRRRLFDLEDCVAEHPECTVADENVCVINEEFEGACCIEEAGKEFEELATCFTIEGLECPAEDLCVAELVPGSGVGAQCFRDFEQGPGAIVLYVFLLLYLFLALAIVCDDYFTYALDMLAELLGLSSDVKGATFAAIGSSAPELFVSLADNVIANPPKSVGVGTIVGSAIFNILVIIGASAIVAGRQFGFLKLDYKPLMRDSFFYIISICALIGVAVTGEEARHFEGAILVLLYGTYLVFMLFNQKIFKKVDKIFGTGKPENAEEEEEINAEELDVEKNQVVAAEDAGTDVEILNKAEKNAEKGDENEAPAEKSHAAGTGFSSGSRRNLKRGSTLGSTLNRRRSSIASALGKGKLQEDDEDMSNEPYFSVLYWPMQENEDLGFLSRAFGGGIGMWAKRFYYLLVLPINVFFRFTIPDARYDLFCEDKKDVHNRRKIGYWLEFIMCILHIAFLSHMLVFSAAKFGCLVGIAASVMGLTVLAAGTSVPDMITSVILTKNGEGDAAVANSIGSNVFDILIGLGLPWFIAEFVFGTPSAVATGDIGIAIGFLFGVLIILLLGLAVTRFKLNLGFGVGLILLYVFYVLFELFIRPATIDAE